MKNPRRKTSINVSWKKGQSRRNTTQNKLGKSEILGLFQTWKVQDWKEQKSYNEVVFHLGCSTATYQNPPTQIKPKQ